MKSAPDRPRVICTAPDCEEVVDAQGLCHGHYLRLWRTGVRDTSPLRRETPSCLVETCPRKAERRGYCQAHYKRVLKHGHPQADVPIREVDGIGPHRATATTRSTCRPISGTSVGEAPRSLSTVSSWRELLGRSLASRRACSPHERCQDRQPSRESRALVYPPSGRSADRRSRRVLPGDDRTIWRRVRTSGLRGRLRGWHAKTPLTRGFVAVPTGFEPALPA